MSAPPRCLYIIIFMHISNCHEVHIHVHVYNQSITLHSHTRNNGNSPNLTYSYVIETRAKLRGNNWLITNTERKGIVN